MVREAKQSFLKLSKRRILEKLGKDKVEENWSKWSNKLAPEDTLSEAEIEEFLDSKVYNAVKKVYRDHFKGAKWKVAKKLRMRKPKVNLMRNFRIFLKTLDESTGIIDKVLNKAPAGLPDQFSNFAKYIKNWLKGGNIRDRYNEEYLWVKKAFAMGGGPTDFSRFESTPKIKSRFRGFISCRSNEPPTTMELGEGLVFKRSSRKIGYFKGVTTGPLRSSRPWEKKIKNINGSDAHKEVLSFLAFYDFLRKMTVHILRLEEDVDELSEEIRRVIGELERMDWGEMDTLLKGAHKKIKNGIEEGHKASDFFEIIEELPGPVFGVLRELNHRERELQGQRRVSGERMEKIEKRIKKAKFLIGEIIFVARPINKDAKKYLGEGSGAFEDYGYDDFIEDYAELIKPNRQWNLNDIKSKLKTRTLGNFAPVDVPAFYPPGTNLSYDDLMDESQETLNKFIQKVKL